MGRGRRSWGGLGIALATSLWSGCSTESATQVIARIDAEPTLREAATSMRVQVFDAALVPGYDQTRPAIADGWPASVPISARVEASDASFVVVASLRLADATELVVSARSHFIPNERSQITLTFTEACRSVSCGDPHARTCVAGSCLDACVEPNQSDLIEPVRCMGPDGGIGSDGGSS